MSDTLDIADTSEAVCPPPATAPGPMSRLVANHGAQWVSLNTLQAWAAQPGDAVLLIAGDAVRFPEGQDVAVVLPELRRSSGVNWRVGVATPDDEDDIGRRYGAQRRPSLVFLRGGRYVTTVAGMHDWTAYVTLVCQALAMPTTIAPIGIAVEGSLANGAAGCH